jgi:hypothetical protein
MTGSLIRFPKQAPRIRPVAEVLPTFAPVISMEQFEIAKFERKASGLIDLAFSGEITPRNLDLFACALRSAARKLQRDSWKGGAS